MSFFWSANVLFWSVNILISKDSTKLCKEIPLFRDGCFQIITNIKTIIRTFYFKWFQSFLKSPTMGNTKIMVPIFMEVSFELKNKFYKLKLSYGSNSTSMNIGTVILVFPMVGLVSIIKKPWNHLKLKFLQISTNRWIIHNMNFWHLKFKKYWT